MLLNLLNKRCSVRNFSSKAISEEVVKYILEAGRLSPSGGNEQPWLFGVCTDKNQLSQLAQCAYNQSWITTAPLVVALVTKIVDDLRGGRDIQLARFPHLKEQIQDMDKELYSCLNLEEHQTKIPGTHMVLAALEHGIYSTWISYFDVAKASQLLGLPKFHIASELIAFGYPAAAPKSLSKKPLGDLVFYNSFSPGK